MYQLDVAFLEKKFQENLDSLVNEQISRFSLKFEQQVEYLQSPLLRWLEFRLRYVDPFPREVVFSDNFPKQNLPRDAQRALEQLIKSIQDGQDINAYQGRGLILRNDTSSKNRQSRTDLLWADWNILHFHLSDKPIPDNRFFSSSADYLAFCIVGGDLVAFVDILPHPDKEGFSELSLLKTLVRNWPSLMEKFRLPGVTSKSIKTQKDIHLLRSNAISYILNICGEVYAPIGITGAGTSYNVHDTARNIRDYVKRLVRLICEPDSQFQNELLSSGINDPDFSLKATLRGLIVYEAVSAKEFVLPRSKAHLEFCYLAELHDLIIPEWALTKIIN